MLALAIAWRPARYAFARPAGREPGRLAGDCRSRVRARSWPRMRTGEGPREVAVSSDGSWPSSATTAPGDARKTISVIDLAAQAAISPRRPGRPEQASRAGLRGRQTVFHRGDQSDHRRLRPRRESCRLASGHRPERHPHDWVARTLGIVTANIGSNTISLFERNGVPTGTRPSLPVGKGPEGFDISPDGIVMGGPLARRRRFGDQSRLETRHPHLRRADQPLQPLEIHARWQAGADFGSGARRPAGLRTRHPQGVEAHPAGARPAPSW